MRVNVDNKVIVGDNDHVNDDINLDNVDLKIDSENEGMNIEK